jgi:hypothetical protein
VTVSPTGGYKTLGEIAMVNGVVVVVVKAREWKLRQRPRKRLGKRPTRRDAR